MAAGPLRVLMVNARTTPFGSAIAHYADRLCEHLPSRGVEVERLQMADWGRGSIRPAFRAIDAARADVVHIQFPMNGYGRSVLPHMIALRTRSVATVHEASVFGRFTGRATLLPMLARSRVVFTTRFERDLTARWAPWIRGRSCVIPIGSNIEPVLPREPGERVALVFGSVYSRKGLDDVVRFGALAQAAGRPWSVRIVGDGGTAPGRYERRLRRLAEGLPVTFTGRLDDSAVAGEFARATLGYFPFVDGASERHGSLLPALAAGLPVISTPGPQTTPALRDVLALAASPGEALEVAEQLTADPAEYARLSAAGRAYMVDRSWDSIAARHAALYRRLLVRDTTEGRP